MFSNQQIFNSSLSVINVNYSHCPRHFCASETMNLAFSDAISTLRQLGLISGATIKHTQSRAFSEIFEIHPQSHNEGKKYILKFDTSGRLCSKEFSIYKLLANIGLNTLNAIAYSDKFNYLITERETLIDLNTILKNPTSKFTVPESIRRLSLALRESDKHFGKLSPFDPRPYITYIEPRLKQLNLNNIYIKKAAYTKIISLIKAVNCKPSLVTLVYDLAFCNICYSYTNGQFIFLDMGDTNYDNQYRNIAQFYLYLKYRPIKLYNPHQSTNHLFKIFTSSYRDKPLNSQLLSLYSILLVIDMLIYTETAIQRDSNYVNKFLLMLDRTRYLIELLVLCKGD